MAVCLVPECPALTARGGRCAIHEHAALAKVVPLSVGTKCEVCRRRIASDDWIDSQARIEMIAGVMTHRYRHVGCQPPKATRRTLRKMATRLPLDGVEAIADAIVAEDERPAERVRVSKGRPTTCGKCGQAHDPFLIQRESFDADDAVVTGFQTCRYCGAEYVYAR